MNTHQKMCWNCDGHVHVYELQCPYCGADLSEEEEKSEDLLDEAYEAEQNEEAEQELDEVHEDDLEEELTRPPFQELIEEAEQEVIEEEAKYEKIPEPKSADLDNPLASLLLLLPGSLFFLFGLALFLFSDEGFLVFRFSARYWFLYLVGSWPLLYFGWRSLFPAKPIQREEVSQEEPIEESES